MFVVNLASKVLAVHESKFKNNLIVFSAVRKVTTRVHVEL